MNGRTAQRVSCATCAAVLPRGSIRLADSGVTAVRNRNRRSEYEHGQTETTVSVKAVWNANPSSQQ